MTNSMIPDPTKSFFDEWAADCEAEIAAREAAKPKKKKTPHKKAVQDVVKQLKSLPGDKLINVRNVGIASFKNRRTGQTQTYSYGRLGEADVQMTYQGHAFEFEVKVGRDTQRNSQLRHQQRVEAAGGTYAIVSNGKQALEVVAVWQAQNGRRSL